MDILTQAYEILKNYNGTQQQLNYLKYQVFVRHKSLSDFDVQYVVKNKDFQPFQVQKVVKITPELGAKFQSQYGLDFTPNRMFVYEVIGEYGSSYHLFVKFREDNTKIGGTPILTFAWKSAILDDLIVIDHTQLDVDFDVYDKKTEHLNRKLKEHQKDAAKFLIANKKAMLAHSMGCGKTTSGIIAALAGGFKKILIITPASLKINWKREICLYEDESNIEIAQGKSFVGDRKITVINFDIIQNYYTAPYETYKVKNEDGIWVEKQRLSRDKQYIEECMSKSKLFTIPFDCVIIDEAHKLGNKTSLRYKNINDFLHRSMISNVFLLTGTPFTNKLMNFYNVLKLIDAPITQDYMSYIMRYCNAKKKTRRNGQSYWVMGEPQNLDELYEKVKNVYQKLSLSDIGVTVEKNIDTRYYELTPEQESKYDHLWDEYVAEKGISDDMSDSEMCKHLVEAIIVRKYLAEQMVPNTIEAVKNILEDDDDEKVVVMCNFIGEMESIAKAFKDKAVIYNGEMSEKKKQKAVDDFQNNKKIRVFVGQINAAGVGITLTAGHYLVFNSINYSSTDLKQAEDRIFRITSDKDAHIIYQSFTDDISLRVMEIVNTKSDMADELIKKKN